jgi:methionyl aminopeptidase
LVHKTDGNLFRNIFPPKVVSEPDPVSGHYNPFPTFPFTGSLRPVYPLSPRRPVPASIALPDYANDGIPRSERKFVGRNNITILTKEQQDKMRKVCRYTREVLDAAAREIKPGVTTDYLDEVVHRECIKRNAGFFLYYNDKTNSCSRILHL